MTEYEKKLEKMIERILETISPDDPEDVDFIDWLCDTFGGSLGWEIYETMLKFGGKK